jgi:hypothetical protein
VVRSYPNPFQGGVRSYLPEDGGGKLIPLEGPGGARSYLPAAPCGEVVRSWPQLEGDR